MNPMVRSGAAGLIAFPLLGSSVAAAQRHRATHPPAPLAARFES